MRKIDDSDAWIEEEFDSHGNRIKARYFDRDKKLTGSSTFSSDGRELTRESYDDEGRAIGRVEYYYDDQSGPALILDFDESGKIIFLGKRGSSVNLLA